MSGSGTKRWPVIANQPAWPWRRRSAPRAGSACEQIRGRGRRGQMAVELAVLVPVIIVAGLIIYNLVRFLCLCATFDRAALDAVISQGVAPAGEQQETVAVDEVRSCLEEALDDPGCEVTVTAESAGGRGGATDGIGIPLSPLLTRFVCTLHFHPWPSSFGIAGVSYGPIGELVHERSLVVDRYRPGVIV